MAKRMTRPLRHDVTFRYRLGDRPNDQGPRGSGNFAGLSPDRRMASGFDGRILKIRSARATQSPFGFAGGPSLFFQALHALGLNRLTVNGLVVHTQSPRPGIPVCHHPEICLGDRPRPFTRNHPLAHATSGAGSRRHFSGKAGLPGVVIFLLSRPIAGRATMAGDPPVANRRTARSRFLAISPSTSRKQSLARCPSRSGPVWRAAGSCRRAFR